MAKKRQRKKNKKCKEDKFLKPRLHREIREIINRGGSHKSKKKYNRKQEKAKAQKELDNE